MDGQSLPAGAFLLFQRDSTVWLGVMKPFPQGLFQGVTQRAVVLLLTEGWACSLTDVLTSRDKINLQGNNPQFSKFITLKHLFLPSTCSRCRLTNRGTLLLSHPRDEATRTEMPAGTGPFVGRGGGSVSL